jgi:threonine/homoserine/homoserine lactone efflux protein
MNAEMFVALVVFLFPLAYSPGPGNAFFAAIGASKGVRAALPALAGYHVATFVVTVLIGTGMGVTVLQHPIVAKALAAVGSAYVLWLAWQFIRSARSSTTASETSAPDPRIGFWAGAVVLLLNPKAYYIITVMFTQFLRPPDTGPVTALAITTVFTVNNLIAFLVWAYAGRGLAALFRTASSKKWIDYGFAATLIVVAVWMALPLFVW